MSEMLAKPIADNKNTLSHPSDDPPFGHVPDHTELPYEDGTFVKNFQEHPQSLLLTDSILPGCARFIQTASLRLGRIQEFTGNSPNLSKMGPPHRIGSMSPMYHHYWTVRYADLMFFGKRLSRH